VKANHNLMLVGLLAVVLGACTASRNNPTPAPEEARISVEQPSTRIAYLARRDERLGIYVWDLETRTEKKLTGDMGSVQQKFSWSPDGTRLVFQDGFSYEESELYVANVLSGEVERLTDNDTMDENPDWSPCGDWIAFQSGVDASGGSRLWLISPDSGERKTVINDLDIRYDYAANWPLWSPQATKLAIVGPIYDDLVWLIFDVNTGQMIQLISHEGADVGLGPDMAAWSPDGRAFAYVSDWGGTIDIYVQTVEAQTVSEPEKLTDLLCATRWLSWHPIEKLILFTCLRLDNAGEPEGNLYTVNVETSEVRQLTHSGKDYYGSWSPDGERIVFGTERDGADFVAIMDADGSNLTVIEETKSEAIWSPKWAPVPGPRCMATSFAPSPTAQPSLTPPNPATVILAPDVAGEADSTSLEKAREVLQSRLDGMLERKAQVSVDAGNLRVELASAADVSSTVQLAGQVGVLVFFDSADSVEVGTLVPEGAKVIITDVDISQAQAGLDPRTGEWIVALRLTSEGAQKLADYTQANTGRFLVITYDGSVISSPSIRTPILDGQAVITGDMDRVSAKSLAAQLNSGRLPFRLVVTQVIE